MFEPATFSLFVRRHPPERGFLVAAGVADALSYLERFAFGPDDLAYLSDTGLFRPDFLDYLARLRFTGDVHAMAEGDLFFANEPILEVTAPLIEAQLIETYLINVVHFQSLIATKAARCYRAARGRQLVDFSLRRTHGSDAGLKVARASYIGGFDATSNVLAGKLYGIPIVGTMAHSFVMAFDNETDAFRAYGSTFPDAAALLIDTYDTLAAARLAAAVGRELGRQGHRLRGVRLDSGDLLDLSRKTREVLDGAGLRDTRIYASGGLNEYKLERLTAAGAAIDVFGVGTDMGTSGDAPWLDMAYKLVEYAGRPRLKLSAEKLTYPGRKQVYRFTAGGGVYAEDVLALRDESAEEAAKAVRQRRARGEPPRPLLTKVMEHGHTLGPQPALADARNRCLHEFGRLPDQYKALSNPAAYPVRLSARLYAFLAPAVR
jgi:nicotinate phosphoribosyltransferase